jgi:hypothetical protein
VHLEWRQGRVRLELTGRLGAGTQVHRILLIAEEAHLLSCPRVQPWGPSVSVNTAQLQTVSDGLTRLELEMQSGDVLVIEGRSVSAEPA